MLQRLRAVSGVFSLVFFVLLVTSGWALMAGYVPSASEAFASVLYWRGEGGLGAFLRDLHYALSSALVVSGFVYLLATFLADCHRRERRGWWLGLAAYLVVLGLCFTGFLLPMDQNAYWGSVVRLGIVETSPIVGPPVADLLRGGRTINAATLPRFYALHVSILPLVAGLLLWPFVRRRRRATLGLALAALATGYALAWWLPAPLELPADPTDSDYVPRPEWYFLWLFQFGKYVESMPWVRSFLLPAAGLGLLAALPALRLRCRGRLALAGGWCAAWVLLTALARWEDRALPPRLGYEEAMRARAAEQYRVECYDCHGESGRGDGPQSRAFDLEPPDLSDEATWLASSRAEMHAVIRDGRGEDMPAFGRKLDAEEIDALIDYVESAFRRSDNVPKE